MSTSDVNHVELYGVDHSPWVQAVLLGLHEKRIAYVLSTLPPFEVFRRTGVLMPMARIDGGSWLADSERILVALGFPALGQDERRALRKAQTGSAMHRRNGRFAFWRGFSCINEEHPSRFRRLWNPFWRAFTTFYFFSVITFGRRVYGRASDEETLEDYGRLQALLGDGDYFGGEDVNVVDLQLFGIVQMLSSIPVPPLDVVRAHPSLERLRVWIARMQERFETMPNLYSTTFFEPTRSPRAETPASQRFAFACGSILVWLGFPLTLAITFYLARRVRRRR